LENKKNVKNVKKRDQNKKKRKKRFYICTISYPIDAFNVLDLGLLWTVTAPLVSAESETSASVFRIRRRRRVL